MGKISTLLLNFRMIAGLTIVAPLLALILIHPLTPESILILLSVLVLLLTLCAATRMRSQPLPTAPWQGELGELSNQLAETRRVLDETRKNLGMVADAVHQLRLSMEAPAMSNDGLWECLDLLGRRIDEQSNNLSLVANGMDALRDANPGVELVQGRYAALSDSIVDVATQVDALSRRLSARDVARSHEVPPSA